MTDSRDGIPPAKDVRALFNKASLGSMRYRTFSRPESSEKNEPVSVATRSAAAVTPPPAPANTLSNSKRVFDPAFDMNFRMRAASVRPSAAAGLKAAMAFASCAGGVGKTTLCATIARVLSARQAGVLVADRSIEGILPLFFGLERLSVGGLQTSYPSARRPGYPLTLVSAPSVEPSLPATNTWLEKLQAEASLTLLDLPVFHGAHTLESFGQGGVVAVVLGPDVQSVASLARAQELAASFSSGPQTAGRTVFILNRFDETRTLHREIRAHLEQSLGNRLAPVALRESELVSEALALGMTVLDHAPVAAVVKEFEQLAVWLEEELAKPAAAEKVEIA